MATDLKLLKLFLLIPLNFERQLKNICQLPAEMWLVINFFHGNTDVLTVSTTVDPR